jgi:putative transposase
VDAEGPKDTEQAKRWTEFLSNHREAIAAMNFFTVPKVTFGVLYGFFVIARDLRRILRWNVTQHPTAARVSQQLREAFPFDSAPRYLVLDREHTFHGEVLETAEGLGIVPVHTAIRRPWQDGAAERWVGSCRRDLLNHIIVLNERHLRRLMREYIDYYHDDRTHLGLRIETPADRTTIKSTPVNAKVISMPRLGGLHHRYNLAA